MDLLEHKMIEQIAKVIDAGGPLRVKYCANTGLWVVLNGQLVVETYQDHDKAEDECERLNNLIIATNVVKAMREPNEAMIKAAYSGPVTSWRDMIDVILDEAKEYQE